MGTLLFTAATLMKAASNPKAYLVTNFAKKAERQARARLTEELSR